MAEESTIGLRADGTQKGTGFFGVQKMTDGSGRDMTEFSIGVDFGQGETELPTLVPTLSEQELEFLKAGNDPSKAIIDKAISHAEQRISAGKSPFIEPGEEVKSFGIDPSEEIKRLNIGTMLPRSIKGAGLTRTESAVFDRMVNPEELINDIVKTEGYSRMNDNERKLSLQLVTDQFLEDAEANVFDTQRDEFRDLRQRIREAQ